MPSVCRAFYDALESEREEVQECKEWPGKFMEYLISRKSGRPSVNFLQTSGACDQYLQCTPALTLQREKSGTPARGHYVKQANSLCRTSERQKPDRKCGENGKPTARIWMSEPIPRDARSIWTAIENVANQWNEAYMWMIKCADKKHWCHNQLMRRILYRITFTVPTTEYDESTWWTTKADRWWQWGRTYQ